MSKMLRLKQSFRNTKRRILAKRLIVIDSCPFPRIWQSKQASLENWLGYENPFLINDHVFLNGSLSIAQLGTIEEWDLKNWSVNSPLKYIGHPFHIHINDYQVKDSDTELVIRGTLKM